MEEEIITGQVLRCFFSVSSSVDAKPKLPCINSSVFWGRLTPAKLNTKSASAQYSSKRAGSVSMSYSKISPMARPGRVLSLPSFMLCKDAQRFLPTNPFAPVTRIFIASLFLK